MKGHWFVTVTGEKGQTGLTAKAEADLLAQVNTDVTTATTAAALVDATATEATITTTPGFYYTVMGGKEVGTITTAGEKKLATGDSLALPKPDLGTTDKAFYKIAVDFK